MLKKISSYALVLFGLMIVVSSCKKEYETAENIDSAKIEEYLTKNNVNATKDPQGTGFYYQVLSPGTGNVYVNTDSVRYNVVVKSLLTGQVYYSSPDFLNLGTFVGYTGQFLGINVKGIATTLNQIKPGGSFRIILPSHLGFGKNGSESFGIPSNEILDIVVTTYSETQPELDEKQIEKFITKNALAPIKDPLTGVYYIVTQQGTGTEVITNTSTLTVNYTGRYLDGSVFQSSTDGTFANELGYLLPGWGVLKNFTKGAKIRLIIPSVLAYGSTGSTDQSGNLLIPRNACLDFDVEIVNVTP